MKALSIIKQEHRNLGSVLFTLEKLLEEIEQGNPVELRVFHGLLTYMDRFLDRYHHPKEDQYLFPVLRMRFPDIGGVLDQREKEHERGDKILAEVLKALSAYEFMGERERDNFTSTLRRYVAFERDHAIAEEKQVLPAAEQHLLPDDWVRIDSVFGDNRDPLFGDASVEGFEELHTFVTNLVPGPYGLGSGQRED